jgi:hypothetical protein
VREAWRSHQAVRGGRWASCAIQVQSRSWTIVLVPLASRRPST